MLRSFVLLASVLLLGPLDAAAHTRLAKSTPAAGSVAAAPTAIVLEFSDAVRLTSVTLASAAGAAQKLDASALKPEAAARFSVPVQAALAPGAYIVTWRAVGADTHVVSGEIKFVVAAPADPATPIVPASRDTTPDAKPAP